jgi:hypothetical protein
VTGLFVLTLLAPVFVLEDQVDDEFVMLPRAAAAPATRVIRLAGTPLVLIATG